MLAEGKQICNKLSQRFVLHDIHDGMKLIQNDCTRFGFRDNRFHKVTRARQGRKKQSITNLQDLNKVVAEFGELRPDTNVPIAVYYHVNRSVLDIPLRIRKRHEFKQLAAYDQALTGTRNDFRIFFEWFRQREDIENEGIRDLATKGPDVLRETPTSYGTDRKLKAVRTAIQRLLPGFVNLRVRRQPLVLSNLRREQAFLIEDFKLVDKKPHTYGRDANSILFDVMAVLDRPDEIKAELKQCFRLIDEDKFEKAKRKLDDLEKRLGHDDPELIRARSMIAFVEEP